MKGINRDLVFLVQSPRMSRLLFCYLVQQCESHNPAWHPAVLFQEGDCWMSTCPPCTAIGPLGMGEGPEKSRIDPLLWLLCP